MSRRMGLLTVVLSLAVGLWGAGGARANEVGPEWRVLSVATPTNLVPGDKSGDSAIVVTAVNVGGGATGCTSEQIAVEPRPAFTPLRLCPAGSPVVAPVALSDELPAGLRAVEVFGGNAYKDPLGRMSGFKADTEKLAPTFGLVCTFSATAPSCSTGEPVAPGDTVSMTIKVAVETPVEGSEVNRASVSGGGAASAAVSDPVTISATPAHYGIARGGVMSAVSESQAGGHPNFTTEFFFNTVSGYELAVPPHFPKDVSFDLPAGLVGSAVGVSRCTIGEVEAEDNCPRDAMVGMATLMVASQAGPRTTVTVPVYNIVPAYGEPAAFALEGIFFPVRLDTSVAANGEYHVRVSVPDITSGGEGYMSSITIWGDPAEHDGPGPDAASRTLQGDGFLLGEASAPETRFRGTRH